MGFVERRGQGRWRARYLTPDKKERSKTFRRRVDAERFLISIQDARQRGAWVDPRRGRITVETYWLTELRPSLEQRLRPTTLDLYDLHWRLYVAPALGRRAVGSLSRWDIEQLSFRLRERGIGAPTIRAVLGLVKRVLQGAVEVGYLATNPATGVQPPARQIREMRFLTPAQLDRLVEVVPGEWRPLILLAAWGGLRIGEIGALRPKHLDLVAGRLRVEENLTEVNGQVHLGPPKNKQKRSVALPSFVVESLSQFLDEHPRGEDDFLFQSGDGGPLRRSNFTSRVWRPALKAAGLGRVRFHDLRHTSAALAVAAGAHPKALQARMGHSTIAMTLDQYGHLYEGVDAQIADQLDQLRHRLRPSQAG